jgi:uncharacterized membrane protein
VTGFASTVSPNVRARRRRRLPAVVGVGNTRAMPSHDHSPPHDLVADVPNSAARVLRWFAIGCGLLVVIGGLLLWPDRGDDGADPLDLGADPVDAHVTAVNESACLGDESSTCVTVEFEVSGSDDQPATGSFQVFQSGQFAEGDDIRVIATTTPSGEALYAFYDFQRSTPMVVLALLFVGAVIALGRWRGIGALAGLVVSLVVIVWFALPSLADGHNIIAVALVTAGAVAIVALYLAHGFGPATDVALLSTLASLALTGLLAWFFVGFTELTGFTDDASFTLQSVGPGIDAQGILLAGIVIGSLGVLDDVTVTQVSAVGELYRSDPRASRRALFSRALRIGRDHISSTVNTLFLAYAGATLPLLLLFSELNQSVTSVATREIVAKEIVRAMVGSIGLVASVPISTWLATRVLSVAGRPEQMWRDSVRWLDDGRA